MGWNADQDRAHNRVHGFSLSAARVGLVFVSGGSAGGPLDGIWPRTVDPAAVGAERSPSALIAAGVGIIIAVATRWAGPAKVSSVPARQALAAMFKKMFGGKAEEEEEAVPLPGGGLGASAPHPRAPRRPLRIPRPSPPPQGGGESVGWIAPQQWACTGKVLSR